MAHTHTRTHTHTHNVTHTRYRDDYSSVVVQTDIPIYRPVFISVVFKYETVES